MVKTFLLVLLLASCMYGNAQQPSDIKEKMMDSIKAARIDEAALKYPLIRQFSLSQEIAPAGNISSQLYGKDFFKGRLGMSKTAINLNIPVVEGKKNTLTTSFGAIQQQFSLDDIVNYDAQHIVPNTNSNLTTLSASLNFTHRDSLFGLPVTYNVGVTGLFNSSFSRQRLTGSALVSFTFIQKKNTSLMGGLVGIIDPSSPIPAFLFINYYHRFQTSGIELMVNIPSRIAVRKELSKDVSLSAFGEMNGSNFFMDINNPSLPQKAIYSSLVIKSGLLLEYRLTKKAVLSFSGGFQPTLTSRLIQNGETSSNYFIKNNNGMVPYLQVGISLLPFFKLFK